MSPIKIAFMSLKSNKKMNLFFIAQLSIVLVIVNIILSSYNNRRMLLKPFDDLFSHEGYYITIYNDSDLSSSISKLQGDLSLMTIYEMSPLITANQNIYLIICDDDFYNNLDLPLAHGKYSSRNSIYGIVSPNTFGIATNDEIHLLEYNKKIYISGELTEPTYRLKLGSWQLNPDVRLFYNKYISNPDEPPYVIMPFSSFKKLNIESDKFWALGAFLYYQTSPTSDIYDYNKAILENELPIDLFEIKSNSENYIKSDLIKYIPMLALISFIAIMGLICNVVIHTTQQMKTLSVCYLCGMEWNNAILICFSSVSILLIYVFISVLTSLFIMHINVIGLRCGLKVQLNNIFITSVFIILSFVLTTIAPICRIYNTSPMELLRRNKE